MIEEFINVGLFVVKNSGIILAKCEDKSLRNDVKRVIKSETDSEK